MVDLAGEKIAYLGYCGPIDSAGVTRIAQNLSGAVNQQFDGVYLCLTTNGGYVGEGIFLYNLIRSLPLKVTLHNTGTVASIGATLFTAAQHRVCAPGGLFMMHPVSVGADGTSAERLQASLAAAVQDEVRTETILRAHTTMGDEMLSMRRITDVYITAQQALDCGLVHEIGDFSLPAGNQIFQI